MKAFNLILVIPFFVSGCSLAPKLTSAKPDFPAPYTDEATKSMPQCSELKSIPPDVNNLSSVFKIIAENYTSYWQCSNKVDGWNNWYNVQKRNYESK